jgi:hypothetical protein
MKAPAESDQGLHEPWPIDARGDLLAAPRAKVAAATTTRDLLIPGLVLLGPIDLPSFLVVDDVSMAEALTQVDTTGHG